MGPPRARKAKSNTRAKPRGGENGKMNEQLEPLGLKVVSVTADGNCFFRAVADQLDGNEDEHSKYRKMVVDYLEEHKVDFEPFLEEEVPFEEYCSNMRQDGTWGGHMELQAASLVTKCNICIHRILFPRWQILNFQKPGTPVLQLSYHGEEHYNSVRPVDDDGSGPPKLETVNSATKLANEPPPAKDGKRQVVKASKLEDKNSASVKLVMASSSSSDPIHVRQVLNEVHGDTAAAIEFLIAEKYANEENIPSPTASSLVLPPHVEVDGLNHDLRAYDAVRVSFPEQNTQSDTSTSEDTLSRHPGTLSSDAKKAENGSTSGQLVARNKACPCGSKKKYKTCCGAVQHKASLTILTSGPEGRTLSNKARKDKSRSAKRSSEVDLSSERASPSKELDLGVLCI